MWRIIRKSPEFYFGYTLLLVLSLYYIFNLDKADSLLGVNGRHTPFLDRFFFVMTYVGDGIVAVLIGLSLFFVNRWYGWMAVAAFVSSSLLAQFLKRVVYPEALRPRALLGDEVIHFVDGVEVHMKNSFPSGHTTSAFSIAVLLAYVVQKREWGMLFLALAALVGYSRMYLAQHFLTDVTVGSIIGVVCTWASILFIQGIRGERV